MTGNPHDIGGIAVAQCYVRRGRHQQCRGIVGTRGNIIVSVKCIRNQDRLIGSFDLGNFRNISGNGTSSGNSVVYTVRGIVAAVCFVTFHFVAVVGKRVAGAEPSAVSARLCY